MPSFFAATPSDPLTRGIYDQVMNGGVIWLLLGLLLAAVLFVIIVASNKKRSGLDHAFYQAQWKKIEAFKVNGGAGLQLAIMEADKLLDHALKNRGFSGDTMGERLKSARGAFMNNNAIWDAHKLRNRLAHEQNVQLNGISADQALRSFRAGLKDLGAM